MAGNNEIRKYQDFMQKLREIAFVLQCNLYLKRRQIFELFLHDFRAKKFDWKP